MTSPTRPTPEKQVKSATKADMLKIWGPVAVLAIAAFAIAFMKLEPPAPKHLRIAAGGVDGAYYAFAQGYARVLKRFGFELEVLATAGSTENLELLEANEVDLALMQGGAANEADNPNINALGSVFFEPLWVFHLSTFQLERLTGLAGRTVAVGPEGSGTRDLALDLLGENGLDASTADWRSLSSAEAVAALRAGEVDAAFFVSSASASYIQPLLEEPNIELMSFRRYRAYSNQHPFLSHVTLGEGVIDLQENLPPRDVSLLAAAASLAASKNLHHALAPVLVQALQEVHGDGGLFSSAGKFPSTHHLDLPVQKEAAHFIENGPSFLYRIFGYRTAATIDRLKILLLPFIPLLLIVFKAAPPIYRWRIRSKIYRWYEDLREIDLYLLGESRNPDYLEHYHDTVKRLEKEVSEVSVPLSYMDEFYNLRMHIELIENKLESNRNASA